MIDVSPSQLETIAHLVRACAGLRGACLRSRATWTAKDYSDLDLSVVGDSALGLEVLSRLKEAFEESDLSFRVDVLDWHAISSSFQKVIEKKYEVVQKGKKSIGIEARLPSGATLPRGFLSADVIRWPLVPARDLFELKYGKSLVEENRRPGNIPVYGTNGRCGSHDEVLFPGPGVILGRKGQGPLGVEWCAGGYWVIDTAYSLVPLRSDIDLKYAYYLIKFVGLNHLKDGTSNPTLSRDTFGAQALPLPPLPEQRAIANILSTFDGKIELNGRMNETLRPPRGSL